MVQSRIGPKTTSPQPSAAITLFMEHLQASASEPGFVLEAIYEAGSLKASVQGLESIGYRRHRQRDLRLVVDATVCAAKGLCDGVIVLASDAQQPNSPVISDSRLMISRILSILAASLTCSRSSASRERSRSWASRWESIRLACSKYSGLTAQPRHRTTGLPRLPRW